MDWSTVIASVDPSLGLTVIALWILGFAFKKTAKVPDWSIIFILLFISLVLVVWVQGFKADSVVQAIIAAAVASYGYDFVKQLKDRGE